MPYPDQPDHAGRDRINYTFDEPLPIIVLAQLVVGQELLENTGGQTEWVTDRLYIQPGSMIKFDKGSGTGRRSTRVPASTSARARTSTASTRTTATARRRPASSTSRRPTRRCSSPRSTTTRATTPFVPTPINVTGETTTPTLGSGHVGQRRDPERCRRRHQRGHVPVRRRRGQHAELHDPLAVGAGVHHRLDRLPASAAERTADDWAPTSTSRTTTSTTTSTRRCRSSPTACWRATRSRRSSPGHPFFRGNVMTGNGIDGLAVVTDRDSTSTTRPPTRTTSARSRNPAGGHDSATSTRPSTPSGTRPT